MVTKILPEFIPRLDCIRADSAQTRTGDSSKAESEEVQSPNQKIPDRKTKCVIKTHINIKQNVIFGAKLKPV